MEGVVLPRVAEATGATFAERGARIQSLWSGYGELFRVHLEGTAHATAIVKWVRPPSRGDDGASHARKLRSYEVEAAFYRTYAARCDEACRVATPLAILRDGPEWLFVLEDLDAAYPRRTRDPRGADLDACLAWLARFHGRFFGARPEGLWKTGTYWHLATRREELAALGDPASTARAEALDRELSGARHRTILHGDAKPANFCFGARTSAVAAVDFQYTGGGPGVRDVAYVLHGASRAVEARGLDVYFDQLAGALPDGADAGDVTREWRALYPVAVADFERFVAAWRR